MSFHLEGPWLTTTGKKKGKAKFRTAEQAATARKNKDAWAELLAKWGVEKEQRKKKYALSAAEYKPPQSYRRETPYIPSANDGVDSGFAIKPPEKVYTGTAMKGIGVMHKSNSVPIFSDEEAVAISKMRR